MSKKILVVDDEPGVCDFLKDLLQDAGYTVLTAYNGEEGLKSIQKNRPDLVLLDMHMPKMNGVEMYAKLAEMGHGIPETPVLILSGHGEMRFVFENLPIRGFVTKPIIPYEFLETVKQVLSKE
jgi:two-component system alkaline phosphatase synthesis response regulator PhoP